jgi:hypothetical protein
VELVRTDLRRGAVAHFYRATARSWLDDEQVVRATGGLSPQNAEPNLSEILEQASTAGTEGGFDGPEAHVNRVLLAVNEEGLTEINRLLAETLGAVRGIAAESASRRAERGPGTPAHDRHATRDAAFQARQRIESGGRSARLGASAALRDSLPLFAPVVSHAVATGHRHTAVPVLCR